MSKFEVTLKQLRENKVCILGYNKVICALKGVEYDCNRETYVRYKNDVPISLVSIAESNGLDDALWCLRVNDKEWARDSRLFAVWCARQVQHLMTDKRSINALDVSEKFANSEATQEELAATRSASDAAWAARDAASGAVWAAAWAASDAASDARAAAMAALAAASAARDAQKQMFIKMCNGEAPWQVK